MAELNVFYDPAGGTLTIYWGNPQDEYICEETEADLVIVKDASGEPIGMEYLNFVPAEAAILSIAVETPEGTPYPRLAVRSPLRAETVA